MINNATNASTKASPNEILYEFKLRSSIATLAENLRHRERLSAPVQRALARADVEDAAKHASFLIAKQYNSKHKYMSFEKGDRVYLRLGNGYKLRGIPKSKLGDQRVGPFTILDKVGSLAYRLQLPEGWGIHPVISIAQLEPAAPDSFERVSKPPSPVDIE